MAWFDCATRRAISNNLGGNLSSQRGLVLHHQAGNGSLYAFFNNPAAQVSAHFWVSKGGLIEQYADTARVTWHGRDLNSNWVGVETEGCASPPHAEPMTGAMESALVRLYAEGARRHGWANQLASSNGGRGFGFHRMAVNTACPCQVRLDKRSAILRAAFSGQPPPSTAPPSGGGGGGGTAPPFTATPYFDQRTNARHPNVRTWQDKMRARGWKIGVDGVFGPESERVCRSFQADKRLTVDGKVGPQTWNTTWTSPVT
jgi:N-acetylmuramoyl-L-alanine amidase/Putative peptidoglycan binding domain